MKALALPFLRGRMIDLEDANILERIAIREGVESGAENDELSDAAANSECKLVFGEAGAGGHERAHVASGGREPVGDAGQRACDLAADDAHSQGIFEHLGAVEELVRGSASGDAEGGSAGSAFDHCFCQVVTGERMALP